jgi:hypothetical protein
MIIAFISAAIISAMIFLKSYYSNEARSIRLYTVRILNYSVQFCNITGLFLATLILVLFIFNYTQYQPGSRLIFIGCGIGVLIHALIQSKIRVLSLQR